MIKINTRLRMASLGLASMIVTSAGLAQTTPVPQVADSAKKWSVAWGWNRSTYSESDIHFTGVDHDFTLKHVVAADMQTDAGIQGIARYYLNPAQLTIPQTNVRIAYQWNPDTAIALNLDHMKYVVTQNQTVPMVGCYGVTPVCSTGNQVIADNWLNFEHTDGLNIISVELEKQRAVDWFGDAHKAQVFALVGVGVVLPKTNVSMHMIGQTRNDEFHLAGVSAGVGAGLEVDVYKDVFLRSDFKYGYVNLPDVQTSARGDKASQHFTYNEWALTLGLRF